MVHLALLMMVKNEHLRIEVSLDSVLGVVDSVVVLDTGSTDGTQDIIRNWCTKHNIPLFLKEEPFTTFCKSRNVSLDYLDTTPADYGLLLDCNDELQNGKGLREYVNSYTGTCSAFHVCQVWWNGISNDKYYNVRLVKPRNGWRYKRNVHEYMTCDGVEKFNRIQMRRQKNGLPTEENKWLTRIEGNHFVLFQDRTKDDDKSFKRFARDKVLLYDDYITGVKKLQSMTDTSTDDYVEERNDYARTLFYLAQTLTCLYENNEAYLFYRRRLDETGFNEEVFHSYYRCGELSRVLGHNTEETLLWYLKSFYYSTETFANPRVEALVKLSEYYINVENWRMAYYYLDIAEIIPYPEELILFVDRRMYDYTRYHLMERVGMYVGENTRGLKSGLKAISFLFNNNQDYKNDLDNLKWYTDSEGLDKLNSLITSSERGKLKLEDLKIVEFTKITPSDLSNFKITPLNVDEIRVLPNRLNYTKRPEPTTFLTNINKSNTIKDYLGNNIYNNYLETNIQITEKDFNYHFTKSLELESQIKECKSNPLETNEKLRELYHHYIYCSKLCNISFTKEFNKTSHLDEKIMWNIKALETSCRVFGIASIESYTNLAILFADASRWKLAMLYTKFACESNESNLWNKRYYDYTRWHVLGRVAWYIGNMDIGKTGCINALLHDGTSVDECNLKFYVKNTSIRNKLILACKNKQVKDIVELLKSPLLQVEEQTINNSTTKAELTSQLKQRLRDKIERRNK